MLEEQRYGPHIFGEWEHNFFHRYRIRSCACGALEIIYDPPNSTGSFHAAIHNALSDVHQCRLNKLETTGKEAIMPEPEVDSITYGPHIWGKCDVGPGTEGPIQYCHCGAAIWRNKSGGEKFVPADDPLPDPQQCRLNPSKGYGPHTFGEWEEQKNKLNGEVLFSFRFCSCGACEVIMYNGEAGFIPEVTNPLPDPEQCRHNPVDTAEKKGNYA